MPEVQLGSEKRAVSNIFCVGKNYADHVREMKAIFAGTEENEPVVFSKPTSALVFNGGEISIPHFQGKPIAKELHHEVELVLLIGKNAENLSPEEAQTAVAGYGIGLDMTLRDKQTAAKKAGSPWFISKGFRSSAAVSPFIHSNNLEAAASLSLTLEKNGVRVQRGHTSQMIFNTRFIISYLSHLFGLQAGDLIYTGTPSGIGPVESGDRLVATLAESNMVLAKETLSSEMRNTESGNQEAPPQFLDQSILATLEIRIH
ncbi:MAG: fumarylacetoacetate hydrolase family protein [Chloroherpetonaceae bacterium]|nr:fumarylacetoacetate hydrolase family protein [Chloroherpetonaceae bacterium]